jgi:L-lactate dehydrogenase complex protein LldG
MNMSPAKENILKRVRNALSQPVQMPFPQTEGQHSVYHTEHEGLDLKFAEEFTKLQGKFVFCSSKEEIAENLQSLVTHHKWEQVQCQTPALQQLFKPYNFPFLNQGNPDQLQAAITDCELLIARTGSIVLSAAQPSGRILSVFAPVHIVIAYSNQLVFDLKDGLAHMRQKYSGSLPSLITFATGPSRTADIEKTLVVGVHGPKEVYVFLLDEA